ncbi:MAG TPA: OB-fold nucleic acid binding domain-containing protein [Acetobacteraceae bacterium]|jgi:hypothetical protein|nr:OB-fold nucleic acid binding domain-containing protein [Acetobacteraceae bacterium]
MSRLRTALLAAALVAGTTGAALAQQQPTYDPAQLPAVQGKVAQYTLTPRGDVDGFMLDDGTQVHVPPFLSDQLVFAARPGDAVTIHGLKASAVPMVMALAVTNDASHVTVMAGGRPRAMWNDAGMDAQGAIKAQLHGRRGDLNGVVLQDGTIVRLPPPDAQKMASQLAVGQTVYVSGRGVQNALGKVIEARQIGPSKDQLTEIQAPQWSGRWGQDGRRPGMRGPDGGPEAPSQRPPAR